MRSQYLINIPLMLIVGETLPRLLHGPNVFLWWKKLRATCEEQLNFYHAEILAIVTQIFSPLVSFEVIRRLRWSLMIPQTITQPKVTMKPQLKVLLNWFQLLATIWMVILHKACILFPQVFHVNWLFILYQFVWQSIITIIN